MEKNWKIVLEKLISRYKKSNRTLQSTNLMNLEEICMKYVKRSHSDLYDKILHLESQTKNLKTVVDNYNLDGHDAAFVPISSYNLILQHLFIDITNLSKKDLMLKGSKLQKLWKLQKLFDKDAKEMTVIRRLLKYMNLYIDILLENNLLNCYVTHVIRDCTNFKWRINLDNPSTAALHLEKFLKVCQIMPPTFEITSSNCDGWKHYKLLVNLLIRCCKINLSNQKVITGLLEIVLKIHIGNRENIIHLPFNSLNIKYPDDFFNYILNQAKVEGFDFALYISQHSDTVWNYSEKFSVIDAVVSGDVHRVKLLLDEGFNAFPEHEQKKAGHMYPHIAQVIPSIQLMILHIMKKIELNSDFGEDSMSIDLTREQKECFKIIWSYLSDFYVTKEEILNSIKKEELYLLSNNVNQEACRSRYRKNKRLVLMYAHNFSIIAESRKHKNIFKYFLYAPYKCEGCIFRYPY